MVKKIFLTILILLLITTFTISVKADNTYFVIPGGESIGLKINTGIEVVGKYSVITEDGKCNPWKNSSILVGDYIISVDNHVISSSSDLTNYLQSVGNDQVSLKVKRDEFSFYTDIDVVKSSTNEKTIGLYIKDKVLGIGTLSFIYENKFASLGHGVYSNEELLENSKGDLTWSSVAGIKKATSSSTGEKRATLGSKTIGTILSIKETGVYGKIDANIRKTKVEVAKPKDVRKGNAKIYTVVKGETVEEFDIEVIDTSFQDSIACKGIKIKVTDSTLIEKSGGIVQGMSGSPVIQDGKLIGVVSHVTLDDAKIGYAIYAEWMMEELLNS